ncbi:MAG TPA: outer membrane protein assembly factor BamD [Acidobacteriaceae bacterium]|nr:outer membrane protein assembly factor BamD [Acidobacteriaceae bacterium]
MNRVVTQIAVAGLCVALIPCAFAKKKKKKDFDLSANPLAGVKSNQPDKVLYDKALKALKKGHYDVARLDLQTLLNTYPETEYAMRAKLAIGDTWYKEGGSAALSQAESEYEDFITFFPNTPEAAEAQMKVGDIYFQQMEKPDRDPTNAISAEQKYRAMLENFPDSTLIPRAKQRLREVQEVLGAREFEIGEFYAGTENWAGAIARLQTVADTYPLFSKADQALITLGDAYATEAQIANNLRLPPKAKAELVKVYDDRAAAAWDRVVTRYPMAPHVEDAKDRLIAMGRDVPEPTQEELAENEAEEGSRVSLKLRDRAMLLIKSNPSTVQAARVGEPTVSDPPPTLAPSINKANLSMYQAAFAGKPIPGLAPNGQDTTAAAISKGAAPPAATQPAGGTLQLETVPDQGGSEGSTVTVVVPNSGQAPGGSATGTTTAPASDGTAAPAGEGTAAAPSPATAASPVVQPVGPVNNQPLPPIDKPAAAPAQINDAQGAPAVNTVGQDTNGKKKKKKKAPYNKKDESSSKHHGKKGVDKLNPF